MPLVKVKQFGTPIVVGEDEIPVLRGQGILEEVLDEKDANWKAVRRRQLQAELDALGPEVEDGSKEETETDQDQEGEQGEVHEAG